ncbi:AsmA family protein [Ruegeria sediminis]|uniref:AsmA family protein n=1 Tax=Ruegeria sediminis TaxID=2583820 RepID=A0ABY2WUZ9_9RHOB|nr:AsmA family protein [Ruegeria sediminis]TMV06432.1 AsmA family protein [Ruegeria sediminis]
MRGVFFLIILAVFAGLMVIGQTMHAPAWLRDRVETRVENVLGGLQIRFGDVSFVIHEGWRPRLRLRDVTISDANGSQIAQLSDMQASLAMRPLLRGNVQPKQIFLSGAQVSLLRDQDGVFSLTVGSDSAPVERAPNLPRLIEQSDDLFLSPALSALTSFELDGVTLEYRDLRQGRSWTLDSGRVQVTRSQGDIRIATGFSLLSGRDYSSEIEANYSSTLGSPAAQFGVTVTDLAAEDIAGQGPALAWLEVLRAPISGALRGSIDGNGALGPVFATLQIGAGALQPNPETRPIPFEAARTYFTYEPSQQALRFNEVSIVSAWGTAQADGRAILDGVETGTLKSLSAQFKLSGIRVNPAGVFPDPLELSSAEIDFQMKLAPFRLQLGQMVVEHDDRMLRLTGDLTGSPAGWDVNLDAGIDRMTPEQLLGYWPEKVAAKPREWVTENLTDGQLKDLDLALRLRPGEKPNIYADFDFEKARIKFAKTLPPVVDARGQASLVGRRFSVTAHRGWVVPDEGGAVNAAGTSFIIPDVGIPKSAPGIARIRASGSVTAALSLLDRPPLEVMSKAGQPVDLAEGMVNLEGTLSLPLRDKLKLHDMRFHYTGTVSDVRSDKLVPGVTVSADGLEVNGDQTQIALSGSGLFGAVPMTATWRQPIGGDKGARSRLSGQIELSPRLMEEIHAGLPNGMLTGQGQADVTVDLGGGEAPALSARSDLIGVSLSVPELGWRKSPQTGGDLSVEVTLGEQMRVDALEIDAAGLRASGTISFTDDAQMDRISFSSFRLGNWLSVPAELVARGRSVPDIRVLGGVIDMRGATFGSGGGGGAGPRLDVRLNRLQVTDTIAMTGLNGSFTTTGGVQGPFTAQVNGGTAVSGQVSPQGNRSAVVLQSEDAGGVLRSAGLLNQAHGGDFRLALQPVIGPGHYDAAVKMTNTRIKDAPAMAALLNAISVVGLLDEMSGQGIFFNTIDSKMRIAPQEVTVLSGSAVGPSIGLSFDGRIDTEREWLNLQGAISPIYMVNAIGSLLTRKGEGVFAFNYTLRGPLSAPQVGVNPLSGLAPVFLRDLMRAPPPRVPGGGQGAEVPEPPANERSFELGTGDR